MFDAGSIIGKLDFDISDYTRGMMQANGIAQVFPSVVSNFLASPLLGLVDVAKKAAGAIVSLFTEMTDRADAMNDMANQIGVSTEWLSRMEFAASQAGAGMEDVSQGMRFFHRAIQEATSGNAEAAAAFARVGMSVESLKGMNPEDAFIKAGAAMGQLSDAAERTDLAMRMFGRGGTGLIPMFREGEGVIRRNMELVDQYGATVTAAGAASADAWGDMIGELKLAWTGFKQMIAEPMRDALMPYLRGLLDWMREHPEEIKAKAKEIADAIVKACELIAEAVQKVIEKFEGLAKLTGTLAGAKVGAGLGSFFGPIGTGVGAVVGGIGGYMAADYVVGGTQPQPQVKNQTIHINVDRPVVRSEADVNRLADSIAAQMKRQRVAEGL